MAKRLNSGLSGEIPVAEEASKKLRLDQIENTRPGDWVCTNCNDHNYSFREFCRKCFHTKTGEKKQMSEGKKPGDWNCQSCAHLNYQFRVECQKCQRKKPWNANTGNATKSGNPNDWSCPNCGDHVFASRSACRKCQTPKQLAIRLNMTMMGNKFMPQRMSYGMSQGMFQGTPQGMFQGTPQGMFQGTPQGRRVGDWNCISCGDMQYAFRTECRKCGTAKPPGAGTPAKPNGGANGANGNNNGRPGDWNCPSCGDQQYAFRTECRKCGTAKPPRVGTPAKPNGGANGANGNHNRRPGDWDCPACGDMQYASRNVCRKCNTAKLM